MAGTHTVLLTLLPTVLVLTVLAGVESAAVKDVKDSKPQGAFKRVFMPASDASNFFKRRGRRSPRTYEEYYGECSKTVLFPHLSSAFLIIFVEQYERTREKNEQWREFHYDGQHPRYPHHRHYV
uniref:Unique cartilage matrix-associated protein n=1 Tax=Sinocyclocheilus rhinocerous TaxID=307959 RepID=A0A673N9Y3_9TELE